MKSTITFNSVSLKDSSHNDVPCSSFITKDGSSYSISFSPERSTTLKEAVLFSGKHNFPSDTKFYADGYQMLSQYSGTISHFDTLTGYTDKDHYKMPQTDNFKTVYNYVLLGSGNEMLLIGATSCNRFRTEIRINNTHIQIVQCLENIRFDSDEKIQLESMAILKGEKNSILRKFAEMITQNHPAKKYFEMPVGWCSWYCIGPNISENDIFKNLKVIKEKVPELKYIQIDDGFQPFMGDWLETSNKFNRPMKDICNDIKKAGFEPAIWLAPFIASPNSKLLKEHPDYFIKDENGRPLCSGEVSFGGWRDGPWYMIDGTNPNALKFIYDVVREIYQNWNVRYFKLDANVWGALPFGIRYDKSATAVEAYRKGMQAICTATDNKAFILGCNAPMWPSLGLVTAMRVTNDVVRKVKHMESLSKQCFSRNWMHQKLWINDPDCLIMSDAYPPIMDPTGKIHTTCLNRKFYKLNNIYVRASGGMVLSGDYISKYTKKDIELLKKILDTDYKAVEFDDNLEIGSKEVQGATEYFIFNRSAFPKKYYIPAHNNSTAKDLYTNKSLKIKDGKITVYLTGRNCIWIKVY